MGNAAPVGEQTGFSLGPSILSGLIMTAQTRRRQLATRLIIAAVGGGILWGAVNHEIAVVWLAAVFLSQIADNILWRPFRDSERTEPASKTEWIILCFCAFNAALIYSFFPAALWWLWGAAGKIFAMIWLAGALLHVTMHMHHERRTFIAAILPHAIYFFGLPIYSLATGAEPGRIGSAALIIAALLYTSHLVAAFKEYQSSSAGMRLSREQALRRQAAAEQASEAKSVFLANMSHEIRTPMNGILGMADALNSDELTPAQREKVRAILDSGDLLMMLLNDLLDLSKIEANKIEIEKAPFTFEEIARKVESLHGMNARAKGLEFIVSCDRKCDLVRLGDGHRLLQVLHNLVANAIKFTSSGAVEVRITAPETNEQHARIEVIDSGIGVSKDQAKRIFEPFTQADVSTTRKFGGTGLGLSIAKGLVDAMGGDIRVKSKPGKGSRFIVEFPAPVAPQQYEKTSMSGLPEQQEFTGLRVLVGEDNAVNRSVLSAFLKERNHEIHFATDGLAVVDAFKKSSFDIVLMDISMPVLDGPEALRQIRFLEREQGVIESVPVIGVSAHAMPQQVQEYLSMGFNGYVTKPIRSAQLHGEIERVLRPSDERPLRSSVA